MSRLKSKNKREIPPPPPTIALIKISIDLNILGEIIAGKVLKILSRKVNIQLFNIDATMTQISKAIIS